MSRIPSSLQDRPSTDTAALDGVCFGRVVSAWAEHGAAVPVAVVVSVVEDLLDEAASGLPAPASEPSLDDVVIDAHGFARLAVGMADPVAGVSKLMFEALSGGREDAIPAAAFPVLRQALCPDPWVRPADLEVLRAQVRRALGAPATREEVAELVGFAPSARSPEPAWAESFPEESAVALLVAEDAALTVPSLVPEALTPDLPAPVPERPVEPEPIVAEAEVPPESEPPVMISSVIVEVAATTEDLPEVPISAPPAPRPPPPRPPAPPPVTSRPVVRHPPNRDRPVSLSTAPAARLPIPGEGESPILGEIQLPNEGKAKAIGAMLLIAAMIVAALLYFLNP